MIRQAMLLVAVCVGVSLPAFAADDSEVVKKCLAKREALEREYNLASGDFYADTAVMRSIRKAPDGTQTEKVLTGEKYKRMLPKMMPLAKQANDITTLEEITVKPVAGKADTYSVIAVRNVALQNRKSPYKATIVVGKDKKCQITEETIYSQ